MEKSNLSTPKKKILTREEIYEQKFPRSIFLGGIIGIFFISLIYNLPLERSLKTFLSNKIYSIQNCPMDFSDVKLHFFLPRIEIHDFSIQGRCFGKNLTGTNLKNVALHFLGPSFSPLGVKIKVSTHEPQLQVNAYANLGIKEQKLKIEDSLFNAEFLSKFLSGNFRFAGKIQTNGLAELKNNKLENLSIKITSPNIILPQQNINAFDLPQMRLGPLILSGKLSGKSKAKTFKLLQLNFGDKNSDLELDISGDITLNTFNMGLSQSKLDGKIKLSKKITEAIPLLNLYLGSKKPKKGYYLFELKGPLNKIKPKFL